LESELPSPGSLCCPVVSAAPAVAPDLPLSPPALPALFAPVLECAELSVVPLDFADVPAVADVPALAEALAVLADCEELADCFELDEAVAAPLPLALFEELEELAEEPAAF